MSRVGPAPPGSHGVGVPKEVEAPSESSGAYRTKPDERNPRNADHAYALGTTYDTYTVVGTQVVGSVARPRERGLCGAKEKLGYEHLMTPGDYRRLCIAREELSVKYDSGNPKHEAKLMKLWDTAFPGKPLAARKSAEWEKLGFQGKDPATDFRGAGIKALDNMLYFAEGWEEYFRHVVTYGRDFGFGAVSAVLTLMLKFHLGLNFEGTQSAMYTDYTVPAKTRRVFASLFAAYETALSDLFCLSFMLVDRMWEAVTRAKKGATLLDFPLVHAEFRLRLDKVFKSLPDHATLAQFSSAMSRQIEHVRDKGMRGFKATRKGAGGDDPAALPAVVLDPLGLRLGHSRALVPAALAPEADDDDVTLPAARPDPEAKSPRPEAKSPRPDTGSGAGTGLSK